MCEAVRSWLAINLKKNIANNKIVHLSNLQVTTVTFLFYFLLILFTKYITESERFKQKRKNYLSVSPHSISDFALVFSRFDFVCEKTFFRTIADVTEVIKHMELARSY